MYDIDIFTSWPTHVDYPLFRYWLEDWSKMFNKIYILRTQDTAGLDLFPYFYNVFPKNVIIHTPPKGIKEDWRDNATSDAVKSCLKSNYALFLEQDFLVKGDFWKQILPIHTGYDWICYIEGERIHPAFSLIKRDLVFKTSLNFAAKPPFYDHFGLFFQELSKLTVGINVSVFSKDFYHMAGLTQNYHCFKNGEQFYRPEQFLAYNHYCLELPIKIPDEFLKLSQLIKEKYGSGDIQGIIKDYFPVQRKE